MDKLTVTVMGNTIQLRGGGWKEQMMDPERLVVMNGVRDIHVVIAGPSREHNTTWTVPPIGDDGLLEMDYAAPFPGHYDISARQEWADGDRAGVWGAEAEAEVVRG